MVICFSKYFFTWYKIFDKQHYIVWRLWIRMDSIQLYSWVFFVSLQIVLLYHQWSSFVHIRLSSLSHVAHLNWGRTIVCPHMITPQLLTVGNPTFALLKQHILWGVWRCRGQTERISVYKNVLLQFYLTILLFVIILLWKLPTWP